MIELLLGLAAASAAPASAEGRNLVDAVEHSIAQVRARHASLPPASSDTERLIRLGELDRAPRMIMVTWDFGRMPISDRDSAIAAASAKIEAVDASNLESLLNMLPNEGWFWRSRYGDKASNAAFHIVQHSDLATQKRFLPVLEPLVAKNEVDGQNAALMSDRVAISEGRRQRYGSQFRCDGGKNRPYPIEDEAGLNARRAEAGMPPFYEYKARMQLQPNCPQTRSPPPPGMKLD